MLMWIIDRYVLPVDGARSREVANIVSRYPCPECCLVYEKLKNSWT